MIRSPLALLALAALSCAAPPPPSPASRAVSPRPPEHAPPAVRPVAPAHRGEAMASRNAACEGCHPDVAAEWRASLHRSSWTEPAFQRAYDREPLAFCRACHAPEASPAALPSAPLGALGVGCVTCHLDGEDVLAASQGTPRRRAPHPEVRDGRLDGAFACGGCHEFSFPESGAPLGPPTPMQSTGSEHRASPAAGRSCASCHMPLIGGHRSHRFAASRDEGLMRAALEATARRAGPTSVEVRLVSRVEGHAFPTGDLFRRIEVLAEAVGPDETLAVSGARYLGRHFPTRRLAPGGPRVRVIGPDDRLRRDPVTVVLDLGDRAAGLPVRWRVTYQRVAHPRSADERESRIDGEIVLAQGELSPVYARPPDLRPSRP